MSFSAALSRHARSLGGFITLLFAVVVASAGVVSFFWGKETELLRHESELVLNTCGVKPAERPEDLVQRLHVLKSACAPTSTGKGKVTAPDSTLITGLLLEGAKPPGTPTCADERAARVRMAKDGPLSSIGLVVSASLRTKDGQSDEVVNGEAFPHPRTRRILWKLRAHNNLADVQPLSGSLCTRFLLPNGLLDQTPRISFHDCTDVLPLNGYELGVPSRSSKMVAIGEREVTFEGSWGMPGVPAFSPPGKWSIELWHRPEGCRKKQCGKLVAEKSFRIE